MVLVTSNIHRFVTTCYKKRYHQHEEEKDFLQLQGIWCYYPALTNHSKEFQTPADKVNPRTVMVLKPNQNTVTAKPYTPATLNFKTTTRSNKPRIKENSVQSKDSEWS